MHTPKPEEDLFMAAFRAKLLSSQLDLGYRLEDLAPRLGIDDLECLRDYFGGRRDMPVGVLHHYAKLTGRPIWWFFGEEPTTISIDSARTALGHIERLRVYVDALEGEFSRVVHGDASSLAETTSRAPYARPHDPVVVDFAPYLSRARAILEREAEHTEDSEEVFEESVEMIAHSLYSIEMAQSPLRDPKLT